MRSKQELWSQVHHGWNLGNALDSFCFERPGTGRGETEWGNPPVTKELLDTVAAAGFDLLRIPVTWFEHFEDGSGTIQKEWMDRVQEIVDWGIQDGFFVILNMHHENSWMFNSGKALPEVSEIYRNCWRQIAGRFRDYPDALLFEAMNEPRIEGADREWSGETAEVREKINHLQRIFVREVRSMPSHADRTLLLTTCGAVPNEVALRDLWIPEDSNIAVSLHLYQPGEFCNPHVPEEEPVLWTKDGLRKVEETFSCIQTHLTKRDIPVVLTEFGAADHHNEREAARWAENVVQLAARQHISCIWWDNNSRKEDGDGFAILQRENLQWVRPLIRDVLTGDCRALSN